MPDDLRKTKAQLLAELNGLRHKVRELESGSTDAALAPTSAVESEGRFTGIFDSIKDGLVKLDRIGNILDVNKAAADIFGGSKADLIGKHFTKIGIFSLADIPGLLSGFKNVIAGTKSDSEITIKNKNGREFHLDCRASVLKSGRKPVGVLIVVRDVTKRKKIEQQLLLEKHRLPDVTDNMNCGLLLLDNQARVTEANALAQKWLGDIKDIKGKTCYDLFGLKNPDTECAGLQAVRTGRDARSEAFAKTINGDKKHFYAIASPALDSAGHVSQVTEVIVDITDQKRAEKALRDSEELNRSVIEHSPLGISIRNSVGGLLAANESWKKMWSVSDQQYREYLATARTELQFDEKDDYLGEWVSQVEKVYTEGGTLHIPELHLVKHRTGSPRWVSQTFYAITCQSGKVDRVIIITEDITDRKQTEEKLAHQQYYLKKAQEIGSIGTWELDLRQNKLVWTEETYRIFGIPPGTELTYEIFLETVHPDDREYVNREWTAALKGGPYDIEHRLIIDGEIKWIREKADIIFDEENHALRGIGFTQDITRHKRIELALRDSEERFKKLFNNAPVGYQSLDKDGRFLEVNETWCTTLGYSKDEVIGRNFAEFIDPSTSEVFERCFPKFKAAGLINGVEHTMVKKDGSKITASFEGRIGYNEDGSFKQTHCIFTDITERKRVETALKESEQTFRLIAERAFDVIIMLDLEGIITYVSPSIEHVFGYAPANVIGKSLTGLIPSEERKHFDETIKIMSSGRLVENHMSQLYRKDGTVADIEVNAVPIYKEDKVVGAQGIIRDITETKRLRELESRAQRLETAGQIAGQVAHDFNNLLAPLLAYPDFIREELPENHIALPFLNDIEKAAAQIAEINQQLLTLGRRGHYSQEPLNLNGVVSDVIKGFEFSPEAVNIISHLDDDLMNIMAGRAQLHRVLTNLVHNAKDAVVDGGQITIKTENYYVDNVSVRYGRVPKGEYIKLTVSDTGCGIPPDILQKVFDPFFTRKTTDKKRGSGLGLSVVDAVLKDHHGYIDASSKVGVGTSFYLYFPITRELAEVHNRGRIVGGTETLLIVDDDSIQRDVSSRLLKRLGYDVQSVQSGKEAIDFLKKTPQDLLILDMIMPGGIDGTETYRCALEINPNQRAIIVSGFAGGDRVQTALEMGAGAFVRKPLTRNTIAEAVRTELDRTVTVSTQQS